MGTATYTKEWWESLSSSARREVIDVCFAHVDDLWDEAYGEAPLDISAWRARYRQLVELAAVAAADPWGAELVEELRLLDKLAGIGEVAP